MEKKNIVDHKNLHYKGLFNITELYKLIDNWFMNKGYTKHDIQQEETVEEDGKRIYVKKEPVKRLTDYIEYVIRCEIECDKIKEVEHEKDGKRIILNQGDCGIILTGFLVTDYQYKWEKQSIFYFLRGVIDKYVWRVVDRKEDGLVDDCNDLIAQVRGFLNLHRY